MEYVKEPVIYNLRFRLNEHHDSIDMQLLFCRKIYPFMSKLRDKIQLRLNKKILL